ncbi:SAP30 binding protein [Trichuris trichiura]|uniref:SAP30 binding protein n=1 Tax=Trichuris trichiura TaxID=36087 RepID=A0A077Z7C5_TRITR|nr:SAP30 binding protein [Trichuris trichiura]
MELIRSSAIKILADYGDSDEEGTMEIESTDTIQQVHHGHSSPGLMSAEMKEVAVASIDWDEARSAMDSRSLSPSVSKRRTADDMEPSASQKGSQFLTSPSPTSSPVLTSTIGRKRQGSSFIFSSKEVIGTTEGEYMGNNEITLEKLSDTAEGEMIYDDDLPASNSPGGSDNTVVSSLVNLRPTYPCPRETERKFEELFRQKEAGFDFNKTIQNRTDFRNPSIYEKLVEHFDIDEVGSNFPKTVFDPHDFHKSDFYEELARAQKGMLMKLEKANRDRDIKKSSTATINR